MEITWGERVRFLLRDTGQIDTEKWQLEPLCRKKMDFWNKRETNLDMPKKISIFGALIQ